MRNNYQIYQLNKIYLFIKSIELSEDSFIGLADFFQEMSEKSLIITDVHSYIAAFMNAKVYMHFLSSIEIHLLKVT